MKLQRQVAYRKGKNVTFKRLLIVPLEVFRELGWKDGAELDYAVRRGPDGTNTLSLFESQLEGKKIGKN